MFDRGRHGFIDYRFRGRSAFDASAEHGYRDDPKENKIGEIDDVLIDKDGRIAALVISVGGFLGVGEKDVAVPFSAVKGTKKGNKWWLTLNESKDSLKKATGFKYNKETTSWSVYKK